MSFLWSWGGVAVGTKFKIIAGCLQGVQMLMKFLYLIIKDANLRERQRDIVGNPLTFQKPASWSDNLLSNFILLFTHYSSLLCVCWAFHHRQSDNWKPEEWKKTCLGNTIAASHTVVIKTSTFLPEVCFWRTRVRRTPLPTLFRKSTEFAQLFEVYKLYI